MWWQDKKEQEELYFSCVHVCGGFSQFPILHGSLLTLCLSSVIAHFLAKALVLSRSLLQILS